MKYENDHKNHIHMRKPEYMIQFIKLFMLFKLKRTIWFHCRNTPDVVVINSSFVWLLIYFLNIYVHTYIQTVRLYSLCAMF